MINVRDTFDFPSLNGQHTTVLPCARTRKQNQSVNTRDLNSFPALGQEPAPPAKPQKQQSINNRMAAAAVLKKPAEPPRPDRSKDSTVTGPRLPNQARDFPSLDGNQQQQQHLSGKIHNKDVSASTNSAGSSSSWVSRPMTTNQDEKKKIKKEPAAIKKKIAEAPKVPGPSDFPNLNKKLGPSKSNLAQLGNKKKTPTVDNNVSKKTVPPTENINNNNGGGQNVKKNGVQTTIAENNNNPPRKAADNVIVKCTTDSNNKENSRPKSKCAETMQCNGDSSSRVGDKTSKSSNANAKTGAGSKKEVQSSSPGGKKKENSGKVQVPEKHEETVADTSNPKDKKKRKKNENKESTRQPNQEDLQHHDSSRPLVSTAVTPKIPPGFENTFQQQNTTNSIRAPPGMLTAGNRHPQTRIKAPPGLSLTTAVTNSSGSNRMFEYLHPVGSSVRNKMLINNLVAALIPARDDRFDTFERFKEMSTLFRKNVITAFDFYSYCVEALHPHHFEAVFLELVLLLPDIQKQQVRPSIKNSN